MFENKVFEISLTCSLSHLHISNSTDLSFTLTSSVMRDFSVRRILSKSMMSSPFEIPLDSDIFAKVAVGSSCDVSSKCLRKQMYKVQMFDEWWDFVLGREKLSLFLKCDYGAARGADFYSRIRFGGYTATAFKKFLVRCRHTTLDNYCAPLLLTC